MTNSQGYSLLEVLMAIAVSVIVCGAAVPLAHGRVDRTRAAGAARYVAGRLATARFEAVRRSAYVAIRFVDTPEPSHLFRRPARGGPAPRRRGRAHGTA